MDDEVIPVDTEKPPKERVKLTHSTWAKVGAIALLYVSLICVLICAACYAASVSGWGDAEYIKEYVLINLDYTQPGAMTVAGPLSLSALKMPLSAPTAAAAHSSSSA